MFNEPTKRANFSFNGMYGVPNPRYTLQFQQSNDYYAYIHRLTVGNMVNPT